MLQCFAVSCSAKCTTAAQRVPCRYLGWEAIHNQNHFPGAKPAAGRDIACALGLHADTA